ncbi:hypothetical protein SteCoe_14486 [Stentor coeruleus]|uniref:Uncharacterized protein n=1 Tax=Stentor coeruleus TaxID=5963 RepID=A0A1R2C612_9CILI|nr:hypothetical protein SteCoe_14486 [Stentor coeruleus]
MSELQVIQEEDSGVIKYPEKNAYIEITSINSNTLTPPKPNFSAFQNPTPYETPNEISNAENSLEIELEKIKDITKALENNIKTELKAHKQISANYLESNKSLNNTIKKFSNELDEAKTAAYNAFVQSCQNCQEIKSIRQSLHSRNAKSHEEQFYKEDCIEVVNEEVLQTLKSEINTMHEMLYSKELMIEEKEKENDELKLYIDKCHEIKGMKIEEEERKVGCGNCVIS